MSDGLEPFRKRLDELDEQIVELLGERFDVCRQIARFKSAHEIPMMQPGRVAEVRGRYLQYGKRAKLPEDFVADLFEQMIAATCAMEDELIASWANKSPARIAASASGKRTRKRARS